MDEQPAVESLNVQELFAKQQNPSFLSLEEDELMNLMDHSGSAASKQADLWKKVLSNTSKNSYPFAAIALTANLKATFG